MKNAFVYSPGMELTAQKLKVMYTVEYSERSSKLRVEEDDTIYCFGAFSGLL